MENSLISSLSDEDSGSECDVYIDPITFELYMFNYIGNEEFKDVILTTYDYGKSVDITKTIKSTEFSRLSSNGEFNVLHYQSDRCLYHKFDKVITINANKEKKYIHIEPTTAHPVGVIILFDKNTTFFRANTIFEFLQFLIKSKYDSESKLPKEDAFLLRILVKITLIFKKSSKLAKDVYDKFTFKHNDPDFPRFFCHSMLGVFLSFCLHNCITENQDLIYNDFDQSVVKYMNDLINKNTIVIIHLRLKMFLDGMKKYFESPNCNDKMVMLLHLNKFGFFSDPGVALFIKEDIIEHLKKSSQKKFNKLVTSDNQYIYEMIINQIAIPPVVAVAFTQSTNITLDLENFINIVKKISGFKISLAELEKKISRKQGVDTKPL